MYKHFLKVTFRAAAKNTAANTINILGLALGMASFILIYIHVNDELNYDRFHEGANSIYRITTIDEALGVSSNNVAITSPVLAKTAEIELPEVVESARLIQMGRTGINIDNEVVFAENTKYVEPSFLQLFRFELDDGRDSVKFNAPYKAIVSRELGEKLGDINEIKGKVVSISDQDWEIVGVLKDRKFNSHLELDLLLSMYPSQADSAFADYLDSWRGLGMVGYIKLTEEADAKLVEDKLNEITHANEVPDFWITKLQKLTDVHLGSANILFDGYNANKGDKVYVIALSAIAVFIIFIAVFNFMNLSTAKSSTRAKEVGVRKTVGAAKSSLITQHLAESVMICFIALVLALGALGLISPMLDLGLGENVVMYILNDVDVLSTIIGLTIVVGLLAGSYPALVLSNIKAVNILRGQYKSSNSGILLRKILVIAQFVASVSLIVITLLINKQINYLKNKELGFSSEQVVTLRVNDPALSDNLQGLVNSIRSLKNVTGVSTSSNMPGRTFGRTGITPEGASEDDENWIVSAISFDEQYLQVMNMEIVEGRNYSADFGTDEEAAILVNEAFIDQLGWDEPIGKKLSLGDDDERTIIGVVKDFHYASMRHSIEPLVMFYNPSNNSNLSILISSDIQGTLGSIETIWNEVYQDYPLEYEFFDQEFGQMFASDENFSNLVLRFTWLAIFIACLGLFGLSAYIAEQRRKEIGIRKVLGSSIQQATVLITKEFVGLILVAIILAIPLTYYAMDTWLSDFQYKITLLSISSFLIYFLAALATLALGILTVSYQAISASLVNPVESIRSE
jgi:putative ABC transport system permease protein